MVANANQRPTSTTALVEPDAPIWAQRMVLKLTGYFQALRPRAPNRIWYADKADLPSADEWEGALVVVPDQACIVIALAGVWRKIALGGPV